MAEWKTAGKVRMTPKGTHNPSLEYEVLDVVTNTAGNIVYIAKSDVPENISLSNTDYWAVMINFSGANIVTTDRIATISETKGYLGIA